MFSQQLFSTLRPLARLASALRALIYPPLCAGCRSLVHAEHSLCPSCYASIKLVAARHFPLTKQRTLVVHAAGAYDGVLALLVRHKFTQRLLGGAVLADLMHQLLPQASLQADFLVPIPLHWTRYAQRGFNQSVEIAKRLSKLTGVPVLAALTRQRRTRFQFKLSAHDREINLAEAFVLRPGLDLKDKRIIIVDDLCTTGTTLLHASKALLPQRPAAITAVVGARALL